MLEDKKVLLGGDQLTRVRLQGARGLREHADNPVERYDHLDPVVIEMWHTKQDLLHVGCGIILSISFLYVTGGSNTRVT